MGKRFHRPEGNSAYYPYALRTRMRARQRRSAGVLWALGVAALGLAAVLLVRQTVFDGGQPAPPERSAVPGGTQDVPARVTVRYATADLQSDALAATGEADAEARREKLPNTTARPADTADILPAYRDLYEENPDLAGWLHIEGAGIDLPVMQTPGDNEYYLRRGFDRLYSTAGTLFLDARCSLEVPTANWLVYGHNMADGSMFGGLDRYEDETFYREHPTFTFDTLYEEGTWQVAAVLRTELGADALPYYAFFDADGRADWQEKVDAILALALYDTGVVPEYGDQLLTLSTCGTTTPGTGERFAVLAVRIDG